MLGCEKFWQSKQQTAKLTVVNYRVMT